MLFASTAGAEGIIGAESLRVTAMATPGGAVDVGPGAALMLNRSGGGSQQTYAARNPSTENVPVAATGATARSDLLIVRVEDPQYSPWLAPADPTTAQYVRSHVISNVPAGTRSAAELNLGYSAIALARIDIPANTAAITQAMIVDVRSIPLPRRHREVRSDLPSSKRILTDVYDNTFHMGTIPVPSWATQAHLRGDVGGLLLLTSTSDAVWRANLGGVLTQEAAVTSEPARRITALTAGTIPIPASIRGGNSSFTLQGRRRAGTGEWSVDTFSVGVLDIEFVEVPV